MTEQREDQGTRPGSVPVPSTGLDGVTQPLAGGSHSAVDGTRAVEEVRTSSDGARSAHDEPRPEVDPRTEPVRAADGPASDGSWSAAAAAGRPAARASTAVPRSTSKARPAAPATGPRQRRARLRLRRIDPWSVFVLSLLISLFLAVVLVVAVVVLYAVLEAAGVPDSVNALVAEVSRAPGTDAPDPEPLLSAGRALTAAGVIAVLDVVLVTALATLSAVLYNLCASFTGGLEVTLAEHE